MVSINIGPDDIIKWFHSLTPWGQILAAVIAPLAIGVLAGWLLAKAFHHREVAILERQQTTDKNLIEEYREKLKGASPLEAASKLSSLEMTLAETRKELDRLKAREWQPLGGADRAALKNRLSELPAVLSGRDNRHLQIVREEFSDCAALADDLAQSFKEAGWSMTDDPDKLWDRIPSGIWVCAPSNDPRAAALLRILQDVLGKEYEPIKYSEVATTKGFEMLNNAMVVRIAIGRKPRE